MKTCPKCCRTLDSGYFGISTGRYDGLQSQCKDCRKENAVDVAARMRKRRARVKSEVIEHYSFGFNCCGHCNFKNPLALSVDHIGGGGNKHNKKIHNNLQLWLYRNKFPEGYQILCMNCQFIKKIEVDKPSPVDEKFAIQHNNQRKLVIDHYSFGFKCCGVCNFSNELSLSVDHIDGGGTKHLKSIGNNICRWLIQNNYPEGFQILCMNCNTIKYHEQDKSLAILDC